MSIWKSLFSSKTGKKRIHRDRVAEIFISHCEAEAKKLESVGDAALREKNKGRLHLVSDENSVANSPVAEPVPNPLLASHCFALVLAAGLDAVYGNVDPPDQERVMTWIIHRLIVAKDVGEENVGHVPSPRPAPSMHVSYAPGTFTGGVASELQNLVRLYEEMKTPPHKLVLLLVSLGAIAPTTGIGKAVYRDEKIGPNFVARNLVGTVAPGKLITEWDRDFVITDADAALSELPKVLADQMVSAIECVDTFWPEFSAKHFVTWEG